MKRTTLLLAPAFASLLAVGCELDAHHLTTDPSNGGSGGSAEAGAGGGGGTSDVAGAGGSAGVTGTGGAAGAGAQGSGGTPGASGGTPGASDGLLVDIPPEVIANRLSRLIWNKPADEATIDNIIRRRPRTLAAVREIALEMLKDPQAAKRVVGFFPWWLDLGKSAALIESREGIPTAKAQSIAEGYQEGLVGYVDDVIYDHSRPESLVRMFVNSNGVLEQPAYIARSSGGHAPYSITQRGIFARQRLTCEELPPPPADVAVEILPDSTDTLTLRQRLEKTTAQVSCQGCHNFVDPLGFAFEHFDGLGTRRITVPPGYPVDASGFFNAGFSTMRDQTNRFDGIAGPTGMGALLIRSPEFANCWTRQWAAYLLGRASVSELGETQGLPTNLLAPPYDGDVLEIVAGVIASPGVLFGL